MTNTTPQAGFFRSLVDFGFTTFVTLRFLKVIYALQFGLICLFGLVLLLTLAAHGGVGVVVALIVVPLLTLFFLVLARVSIEMIAVLFRIGENTSILAAVAANGPAAGPGPFGPGGGYGGPAPVDPTQPMPWAPPAPPASPTPAV